MELKRVSYIASRGKLLYLASSGQLQLHLQPAGDNSCMDHILNILHKVLRPCQTSTRSYQLPGATKCKSGYQRIHLRFLVLWSAHALQDSLEQQQRMYSIHTQYHTTSLKTTTYQDHSCPRIQQSLPCISAPVSKGPCLQWKIYCYIH